MTPDEKLDEALKETFPASDPFYLPPEPTAPLANDAVDARVRKEILESGDRLVS